MSRATWYRRRAEMTNDDDALALETVFEEGVQSYRGGLEESACPYQDRLAVQWRMGWRAQQERGDA